MSEEEQQTVTIKQENNEENFIPMPTSPKIKHDWYQTETHVIITILLKNAKHEDVTANFQEISLGFNVKLSSGNNYSLELDLAHPVIADQCLFKVFSSKIEIKLKKSEGIRWANLEGDGTLPDAKQINADKGSNSYPSSAHVTRDWDKLVADIKQEEKDEKPEGDAALNKLFQQIYGDGSDEVKKAMNKSFMESGGTVLSTNWKEVGEKQVEIKPPDGMEYKKY